MIRFQGIGDTKERGSTPASPRFDDFDYRGNGADGLYRVVSLGLASRRLLGSRQGKQGGRSKCSESAYQVNALASLAVARATRAGAVYARNTPIRLATVRRSIFSSVSFSTGGFPFGRFSFDMQNLLPLAEQLLQIATDSAKLLEDNMSCSATYRP